MAYTRETAETLALHALAWLASNEDLLPVFMGSSGAQEADLRDQAGDPVFLASVLEFLMMDDAWIIAFCDTRSVPYESVAAARAALPGGEAMNWT